MRAVTLQQPWASLVANGSKWIETRSWPTLYRGPLAIHAGKSFDGFYSLPGDCEGNREGGWYYGYVGDYQAAVCTKSSDEGKRGDAYLHNLENGDVNPVDIPLGAVVATCRLVDVIPITPREDIGAGSFIGEYLASRTLPHQLGGLWITGWNNLTTGTPTRIEDQREYGNFGPDRFAWLLSEVRPCDPIPAVGHQGLWEWSG